VDTPRPSPRTNRTRRARTRAPAPARCAAPGRGPPREANERRASRGGPVARPEAGPDAQVRAVEIPRPFRGRAFVALGAAEEVHRVLAAGEPPPPSLLLPLPMPLLYNHSLPP